MSKSRRRSSATFATIVLGAAGLIAQHTSAATNQFRGVNWADQRDNYVSGVIYVSGLSSSDTYASASTVADKVISQFMSKLGTNSVKFPINEATVSQYWSTYTGAIDMALSKGKVVLCFWPSAHGAKPANMTSYWNMWKTVVDKYGGNSNCYFEVYNEPNMYSKAELGDIYASWLSQFSTVPKGRVILEGTGMAQNVPDIGSDSRFDGCLLAVHEYSMWGSDTWTTESQWTNHFKGYVGNYADRTICTEWGGPMSPGSKNGINYDYLDYSRSPTNYFEAYIRGVTSQMRTWQMGSFYWIGLRDGDWYSMTKKSGSGSNITLSVPNPSGLERMQYSWGDLSGTGGTGGGTGSSDAGAGEATGGGAGGRGGAAAGSDAGAGGAAAGGTGGRSGADGGPGGASTMSSGGGAGSGAGGAAGSGAGGADAPGGGGSAGATTTSLGVGGVSSTGGTASGGRSGSGGAVVGSGGATVVSEGGNQGSGGDSSGGSGSGGATGPSSIENSGASGCSCRIGQGPRDGGAGLVLLLLALAGLARGRPPITCRRRSRCSSGWCRRWRVPELTERRRGVMGQTISGGRHGVIGGAPAAVGNGH